MLRLALTWGVNHYDNYPKDALAGCVPDAEQIGDYFTRIQKVSQLITLKDHAASDSMILTQIQGFLDRVKKETSYYIGLWGSSHGSHWTRPDGIGEGICCANLAEKDGEWGRGFIRDLTMRNLLNAFPPNGIVEIGLDTCYSGGMDRAILGHSLNATRFIHAPDNQVGALRVADPVASMNAGLNSNIIMWTACSEAETSADAYINGGYHGAFTYYWLKTLQKDPDASRLEILLKTRAALKANHYAQTPRLKAWNVQVQRRVGV